MGMAIWLVGVAFGSSLSRLPSGFSTEPLSLADSSQ